MSNRRFQFDAPANQPSAECGQPECRCCEALRRARSESPWDAAPELQSPLTPGVAVGNIASTESGGSLRVDLWPEWRAMLADLRRVGSVLWMTRHPAAAIGKWSGYPELRWAEDHPQACDENGEVDLDFGEPCRACAKHERRPTGHLFSVEISDAAGFCFHRVCLTAHSSLDAFADWTRAHQAIAPSRAPAPPPAEPEGQPSLIPGDWLLSEPDALNSLLDACLDRELGVHAIVSSPNAIQGHRFVPVKRTVTEASVCFHSEEVALHFEPEKIAVVRLHNLDLAGAECWSLKGYDAQGRLALTLLPASSERLPIWNLLLRALA